MVKFALLGEKLGHSMSPQIHQVVFDGLGIEGSYVLNPVPMGRLKDEFPKFGTLYDGMNVTIPYKTDVMPLLDEIAPEAEKIGAVNTISFKNGKTCGYNTDYIGFGKMLKRYGVETECKTVVVCGTGGASHAIVRWLEDAGAAKIVLVSRSADKLCAMADKYKAEALNGKLILATYGALNEIDGDVIVNCTPVGMYPKVGASPVGEEIIKKFGAAVDIVYNPAETEFLRLAKTNGLKTVSGLYMLVAQAVASEEIWLEREIPEEITEKAMEVVAKCL